jgi:hypothetical protein
VLDSPEAVNSASTSSRKAEAAEDCSTASDAGRER